MDLTLSVSILSLVFAAFGILLRSKPQPFKVIGLLVSALSFLSLLSSPERNWNSQSGIFSLLISASAFLCILSQQPRQLATRSIASIVMLSSFSLACFDERLEPLIKGVALALLLLTFFVLAISGRKDNPISKCTAGFFGIAFLCLVMSLFAAGTVKLVLTLVVAAVFLPLLPFHGGFVGSLGCLPGTVRAFAALVLPCHGWHIVAANLPFSDPIVSTVIALAVCGGILSTIRAIAQIDIDQTFASVGTILFSLAWLNVFTKAGNPDATGWYVVSVALALNGLMLCTYHLRERYGDNLRDNLPGLDQSMPRLGLAFRVLVLAAAGFPPFALYAMTMAMVLTSSQLYVPLWVVVMSTVSSLLLVSVMQQLLFGARRTDLVYEDIQKSDLAALAVLILLLFASGVMPYSLENLRERAGAQSGTVVPASFTGRKVEYSENKSGKLILVLSS